MGRRWFFAKPLELGAIGLVGLLLGTWLTDSAMRVDAPPWCVEKCAAVHGVRGYFVGLRFSTFSCRDGALVSHYFSRDKSPATLCEKHGGEDGNNERIGYCACYDGALFSQHNLPREALP